jgi:3alpha(or 20beta)-hydroxysteroid dehydrogenase
MAEHVGRLENKVAIITGAARGMGSSHARMFVKEGARVVLTDILDDQGRKVAAELGENALFCHHDVCDPDTWTEVVRLAEETFGHVNILVNNAGISIEQPIEEITIESYRRQVEVNQTSVFHGIRAVVPSMRRAGSGSIVNISSVAGIVGGPNAFAYAATKFALRGMTKVAAIEFGKEKIRVNCVHPGAVKTPMLLDQENFEALAERFGTFSPLGRMAEAEEISTMVLYLASDEASFCTGAEFIVDGGATAL